MLQRFGIAIAMPGLIPAFLANGDNNTAHRHLGAVFINAPTLAQHMGGTLALAFLATLKHGLKLAAAVGIGVRPHSPAPWTLWTKACETNKYITIVAMENATLEAMAVLELNIMDLIFLF